MKTRRGRDGNGKNSVCPYFSGRVSLCFVGAQNKLLPKILRELLLSPKSLPLFFTFSFWIHKYTCKNKHNTQNADDYSPTQREFFKEVARQPYNKNCLTKVGDGFGDEFYFSFCRLFHLKNQYHNLKNLSRIFINRVICVERQSSMLDSLCLLLAT